MSTLTPMDITSVDSSSDTNARDGNTYLRDVRNRIDDELAHDSVKDLVDKVIAKIGRDGCIKTLDIVGHGKPGTLVVGGRRTTGIKGKEINGNDKDWQDELKRLKSKFCGGGKVRLLGCSVGVCDDGAKKLQSVADTVGVPVCGTTHDIGFGSFDSDGWDGDADDLVEVKPDQGVTKCLVKEDGSRVKKLKVLEKQPKKLKSGGGGLIDASGIHRIGVRPTGLIDGTSQLHPVDDRNVIGELADLVDFELAYDGSQIASAVEGQISVMYGTGLIESWNIVFGGQGVELARGGKAVVFETRDAEAMNLLVAQLIAVQTANNDLYRNVFGLSTAQPRRQPGPGKELRAELLTLVDKPVRDLGAREILELPVDAIKGVGVTRARALRESLDVTTVRDLAELAPGTEWGRIAVMIMELAELEDE